MVGVYGGMNFHALRTEEFETGSLRAEVSHRLLPVFVARDVIVEVGLHVLDRKQLLHDSNK
jgi:hypothetical protein